jgi:hypothetical protein
LLLLLISIFLPVSPLSGQEAYLKHQLELNIKCTPADALAWAIAEREKNENENPSLGRLKFLYDSYEPCCFLFEVAECVRRLLLTGGLVLFAQGSGSQIVCSMLICILSGSLYSHYEPFVEKSDDYVASVAQTQLFFTLFASLIIRAGFAEEDNYNEIFFDGMLVFIQCCVPLVTIWYLYIEHRDAKKEKVEEEAAAALKKKQKEEAQGVEIGTSLSHSLSLIHTLFPPPSGFHLSNSNILPSCFFSIRSVFFSSSSCFSSSVQLL